MKGAACDPGAQASYIHLLDLYRLLTCYYSVRRKEMSVSGWKETSLLVAPRLHDGQQVKVFIAVIYITHGNSIIVKLIIQFLQDF